MAKKTGGAPIKREALVKPKAKRLPPAKRAKAPRAKPAVAAAKPTKPKADRRGAPKGSFGNRRFKATDEQRIEVCAMVAAGTEQEIIADLMGFSVDTLQRYFKPELDRGQARLLGRIGSSMFRDALDPLKPNFHDARKYVLARRGGWKATTAVESSGPDGGPIVYTNEPPRRDLSAFTEEELEQWERLTAKAEARHVAGDE